MNINSNQTIVALSTGNPLGAISVLRLSGDQSTQITEKIFTPSQAKEWKSYNIRHGNIHEGDQWVDEVLVSYFQAPHSYTGEDVVEISCHSSPYIVDQIYALLIRYGATPAAPGEFTMRRFLNGKIDLSQAEAVADMIQAENKSMHDIASRQMKGQFSTTLQYLRQQLIEFAALMELELDFSEEDLEFADRTEFIALVRSIQENLKSLIASFRYGQVIKEGVPVVIAGKPNAGKSSLLNQLLGEEKAIVSAIEGTTRDVLEDTLTIADIKFRFVDTAGLRETDDEIEALGVQKAQAQIAQAKMLIYLFDPTTSHADDVLDALKAFEHLELEKILVVQNKNDLHAGQIIEALPYTHAELLSINTQSKEAVQPLLDVLIETVKNWKTEDTIIISNRRHLQQLEESLTALQDVENGLKEDMSGDLLSIDIRTALQKLGSITGEIETDRDILGTIFGKFCIGK